MRRTLALLAIVVGLIFAAGQSFGQLMTLGAGKGAPGGAPAAVTWNPSQAFQVAFTNANLTIKNTSASPAFGNTRSTTSHTTGKYHIECHVDADDGLSSMGCGVVNSSFTFTSHFVGVDNNSAAYYDIGTVFLNSIDQGFVPGPFTTGATVKMEVDVGAGLVWWAPSCAADWMGNAGANNPGLGTGGLNIAVLGTPLFVAAEVETSGEQFTTDFGVAPACTPSTGFNNPW